MKKKTKEEFIEESKEVHNNKYDYSKVEYINGKAGVCIICPEHGEFWQIPKSHLKGQGCKECGFITTANSIRKTQEDFIKEVKKVWGDELDFSKVDYK